MAQVREKLLAAGWKEAEGSFASDQSASTSFTRDGYSVSASVSESTSAGKPPSVMVVITNHGNVDLATLPVPTGAKLQYSFPAITSFLADGPAETTAAAVRELLIKAGWAPYGRHEESHVFKQNAVQLSARIMPAPNQAGKSLINFTSELMSADLPAPADALSVQYSDSVKQLSFDSPKTMEEVDAYFRQELGQRGWQPTSEAPIKMDFRFFVIFRNPEQELIDVTFTSVDGKTRVLARYQTAAEVEEEDRRAKEAAERKAQEANKPKPKVALKLPADAAGVEATAHRIEFTVKIGQGKATTDAIRKQLADAGWKETRATLEPMFGDVELTKEGNTISVSYVETGILAPEITITGIGVELERP
jgi:hypothetical protein